MKKSKLFIAAFITICTITISISSCKKAKVKGCMDSDSINYNASAEEDDGSCSYKAAVNFWYNQATSTSMTSSSGGYGYPISTMTYYVNGKVIGSSAATVYNTSEPACGGGAAHASFTLGSAKTATYSYYIIVDSPTGSSQGQDTTYTLYSGSVPLNAHNSCLSIQLQ
jgi:hypothetical protein